MQTFKTAKQNPLLIADRFFGLIKDELALVEEEFELQANSNIQVIKYLGDYLRSSGGKRVRPSLLLLANKTVGGDASSESVIRLATVMEMLHTATLVHDDIIDNADTRRSQASVNSRFGNQTAVLMGDWLYMSAFETSLKERSLAILDILTELTRKMTEGELIQLTMLGRTDISETKYFDILQRKTAYLFSACSEIGAILGNSSEEEQKALRNYGINLGTAFQIADDLFDFTSKKEVIGKASGADLLEGKVTLPLILLAESDPSYINNLESIMLDGEYKGTVREDLLKRLESCGALERTKSIAKDFANKARRNLEIFPKSEYRLALEEIPTLMIERSK